MAKCLVTGGAGFIGSHVATQLLERGDQVRVLDNLCSGFRTNLAHLGDEIEFIQGDVVDAAAVREAAKGCELIFHEAALASVPASLRDPVGSHAACATGTLNVLEAARHAGDQPKESKQEADVLDPLSPYAAFKIASEYYCKSFTKAFGLETVCLRYFNVYGPRQDPASEYSAVIPIFVSKMLRGERPTIYGDGLQSRDFVFVGDVARANLLAGDSAKAVGKSINVGCGRKFTLLELVAAINALAMCATVWRISRPRGNCSVIRRNTI